jgi:diguanylate cyclase (GGDEF)-like protein
MQDMAALHTLVFNSLEDQIAVIDHTGTIVDVNLAWKDFGIENGLSPKFTSVGCSYLNVVCSSAAEGDSLASEAAQGIQDVVSGKHASFYLEYPCHGPNEKRWFIMRVTPLKDKAANFFVISHHNITKRKLAEEQVNHLAMHDPLTGLANRRYFTEKLDREIRRSIRNQTMISLIALDVDYFKEYNDEFGHFAGDQCLENVAQTLLSFARRPSDLAARLGGDEFFLLLGDTNFAESQKVADEILIAINDLKIIYGDSKQVTASMGVASMIPHQIQHEEFLLQEADKALYRAKLGGRNRVIHIQPSGGKQNRLSGGII